MPFLPFCLSLLDVKPCWQHKLLLKALQKGTILVWGRKPRLQENGTAHKHSGLQPMTHTGTL
jgi:hypothetical protein